MSRPRDALLVLALVALTAATRLPALVHPQPIDDEAIYAVVANEMVDGGLPYVDAVERKPPLLFWTYAAIFEAAGKFNWRALHAVALVWTLLTMAGLYVLTRRLCNRGTGVIAGRIVGLLAALLYCVFQPWASWKNLALNGELLMNLPLVWAWAIALGPSSRRVRPELFAAGALAATAFLLKQPAAIAAVPLGTYVLLPSYRASRGVTVRESLLHAGELVMGFFAVVGAVVLVLRREGILGDAFYWTITNHDVPHVFWTRGILFTLAFAAACMPLLIWATLSLRDRLAWQGKYAERAALAGLLVVSAIGTAASGRFYEHYYIQLLPPLAVLAAVYYGRLQASESALPRWLPGWRGTRSWLVVTTVAFSVAHWYGLASQRQPTEVGQYLLAHTAPNDRIFVWGQAPGIYLDAHRRPASRFITTFALTGYIFGGPLQGVDTRDRIVPGAWETLEHDFISHPPVYIVDTESAHDSQYPIEHFPRLANLLARDFEPITHAPEGVIYGRRNRVVPHPGVSLPR